MAPVLKVSNLSVAYGARTALQNVSVEVSAGELVGVIGPNGSGKSTLLKAITRVVPASNGTVEIGGRGLNALSQRDIARRIAVVPQAPALPEAFTALEIVLLGRTPHLRLLQGESHRDIEVAYRAMTQAACRDLAGRRMNELSGGECQRVVLARALAQETPVLLLDEPTAHLDIAHQTGTFDLIRRLCHDEGLAALAVVHDLTLAGLYCDRLLLLNGGMVVASGSPWEVLTPDNIASAFGAPVEVTAHPHLNRPVVVPLASPNGPNPLSRW